MSKIKRFKRLVKDEVLDPSVIKSAVDYYTCNLGDTFILKDGTEVRRVPGGWIHKTTDSGITNSTFVPYNNEFKKLIS